MSPSPSTSEGKARAIRELSRELSHSPRPTPSPTPACERESNPTLNFEFNHTFNATTTTSSFDPDHEALMSTRQMDDDTRNPLPTLPNIRSTAKRFGYYNPPGSDLPVNTSMVNKEFIDFDNSQSEDDSISVERNRGAGRGARNTPGKLNSSLIMSPNVLFHDSLYDITHPPSRQRATPKKTNTAEPGSLRRDAQIRRASYAPQKDTEASVSRVGESTNQIPSEKRANNDRRRSTLAQIHARVTSEDESFIDERPPTVTFTAKNTRFGGSRSRQSSAQRTEQPVRSASTPQRGMNGTPRSTQMTGNATAQSFMLPDLPNLTELVSGVFQDGTPVFSRTARARSRHPAAGGSGRNTSRQPNHTPIDSVPIPSDEKAIFASLQLLKDKVAQLEQDKAESEKKMEEQEIEIIELRAANEAREKLRRPDSGLGSTDGEGGEKTSWKVEKTRLEASVDTLRTRLDRTERKLSVAEIGQKRITSERDNLVTQLGVAFYNSEELKAEKEALQTENETLRNEIDSVRTENESLRDQLSRLQEETHQLRRNADRTGKAVQRENETLNAELARIRAQRDEETQLWARKEATTKKEQAEFSRLKAENDALKAQRDNLKAKRDEEARRWASREAEFMSKIDRRDETIRHFQDMTQDESKDALRNDNENLRAELAQLSTQQENETQRWARKEAQLRRRVEKREEAVRQMEDMTREIMGTRQANSNDNEAVPAKANAAIQRKPSQRREKDTQTRIADRVQEEVRNSRSASAAQPSTQHQQQASRYSSSRFDSGRMPARTSSAPEPNVIPSQRCPDSDVESTTDLSLAPRQTPYMMRGGINGKPTVTPPAPLDLTELSFIDGDDIARLRRTLEEERAAARRNASLAAPAAERQPREDTIRSTVSARVPRPQSLPRKSSMKDVTGRTNLTVQDELTGNDTNHDGQHEEGDRTENTQTNQAADVSFLSQSSRRRRSAPVEMTSAFILPDITIHTRKQATSTLPRTQLPTHDNKNCTVCRRNADGTQTNELNISRPVPVSSRMPDDMDATMRPAQSPKTALALVLKELEDELAHLHLELAAHDALLRMHDPSLGRRKRKAVQAAIEDLLKAIDVKSDQIYNLYDVLEGQKTEDMTEQEVEDTIRSIRVETVQAAKGKGKKVIIDDHESDTSADSGSDESHGEEELPWEGIEDTESLHAFGRMSERRRSSVY
ncbi:hypothetical protein K432DRAFT_288476 [Lepidopterella palustris CBS 459.81]|uniref:Cep57 centrosome microtubule-binding domain-containing protein n=1 Tax=Lepidopterella palustris CBS 459.81 TaxID=1314670 RepID=A0A8E2EII6_9PEZI|nr:hypothetical protein K432DRAFT_288476 [Lepidopterella palustris CBS 459.81]